MTPNTDDVAGLVAELRANIGERPIYRSDAVLRKAADLLESQAKALREAEARIQRLQCALMYWLPGVGEPIISETNDRVGEDALLLFGYTGPIPDDCWGDQIYDRALAAEARLKEAGKVIEPFARAGHRIPDELPDNLWTHCSTYKYEMSDEQFKSIEATGAALKSKQISLTLWIDGHPLRDFRAARAFINAGEK
jgi:hypothetical protein